MLAADVPAWALLAVTLVAAFLGGGLGALLSHHLGKAERRDDRDRERLERMYRCHQEVVRQLAGRAGPAPASVEALAAQVLQTWVEVQILIRLYIPELRPAQERVGKTLDTYLVAAGSGDAAEFERASAAANEASSALAEQIETIVEAKR